MMMRSSVAEDICLTNLTKVFRLGLWKTKTAVNDLTLTVPQGEVMGLLGPNGSGKSTTIKMILGFLKPTSGEIIVHGYKPDQRAARSFIGYLPENPRFQKFLTGSDILAYYGKLLGLQGQELKTRCEHLLNLVGIAHAGNERVQGYSKGMTQRLAIAQALLSKPSLLIFDEPMSGLDPLGRMGIRKLIQDIHTEMPQATIFFSTHILEDVEQLCSSVALLRKGVLKTFCKIEELLLNQKQRFEILVREIKSPMREKIEKTQSVRSTPLGMSVSFESSNDMIEYLNEFKKAGVQIVNITSQRRTLEEALFSDKSDLSPETQIQEEAREA